MKITFCFGGKKRFAAALLAAAMALFLLFGCSSGGDDGPGEIPQNPGTNQGGGQNPSEGENQGGESGGESEEGGNDNPSYTGLKQFFEKNYEAEFNGVTQSTSITLTAQTIKDVVEKTPAFETKVKAVNTDTDRDAVIAEFNSITDNNIRSAIMAQVTGKLNITREIKSYTAFMHRYNDTTKAYGSIVNANDIGEYKIEVKNNNKVSLLGEFELNDIYIKSLVGDIDISNAEIVLKTTNTQYPELAIKTETFDDLYKNLSLSNKDISEFPTLKFAIYFGDYRLKHFLDIYEKYNTSTKININGTFTSLKSLDGRELVDNSSNYTLFSGDNTAKESKNATDIKSMDINTLVKFSNKYNVKDIKNIIVSGSANSGSSVNWTNLTNVIFEGNMSNLKINNKMKLNGIVYFKDLPYNNSNIDLLEGAARFKNLSNTISIDLVENGVLDLRDIDINAMNIYTNENHYIVVGSAYAIYFNDSLKNLDKPYSKIVIEGAGYRIYNAYFGTGVRQNSYNPSGDHPGAKTARSLKEFEYYGNNYKYEKSAYSTYSSDTDIKNTGASDTGVTNLKNDINKGA